MSKKSTMRGTTFHRGEHGYEHARRAALWNARTPERYPDVIVQANTDDDVVDAVRIARRDNLRIAVRSGGHSWAGNHVRDGGMLLDVSRLDTVAIDRSSMRAVVGPGCAGSDLAARLAREKLFFPVGHCAGVCVGGYLLQGGFGWNGRALGPACMSVLSIDYVDAEGTIRHASERDNPDMLWAARGAGPGFFGVVLRFHLRLHPLPSYIGTRLASYGGDRLDDVFRWAHAIGPEVPSSVELMVLMSWKTPFVRGLGFQIVAPVFEDDRRKARLATAFLDSRPRGAALSLPLLPIPLPMQIRTVMKHYPTGWRYGVDNMWTHAPIDELLPGLRKIAATTPPAPSHMLWMNWAPPPDRPSMSFSMEDSIYVALYGVWRDAADDEIHGAWATDRMRELAPLATGIQLADENLGRRPARFVADANLSRLDELRRRHDPGGRFHPWMGRP
ncbi:MAG TPA: FAD-binding oxidoreductase [Kofleriaceae bacterium]|nr:FAD-binding oxidoreductase [Kofleriaceae bacterium]